MLKMKSTMCSDSVALCLESIERNNSKINAIVTLIEDDAKKQAKNTDDVNSAGGQYGMLNGMPLTLKDNIETDGVRTTSGSDFFLNHIPSEDAEIVKRLKLSGGIILGKVNLHEFAFGGTTQNPHLGRCKNPWDLHRIPGGSSGGSGAAVAADMCVVSIGTDTGGSIRIPAALNGVSGLRPTVGRVPNRGTTPVSPQFDTVGPLARNVIDVAKVFSIIQGYDPKDPTSIDGGEEVAVRQVADLKGIKIALPNTYFFDDIHEEVRTCINNAVEIFKDLGAQVSKINVSGVENTHGYLTNLILADAAEFHKERLERESSRFGKDVLERMRIGLTIKGTEYSGSLKRKMEWQLFVKSIFKDTELILTPTVPAPAPLISECDSMIEATRRLTRFTFPWSLAGIPSLSIPCGFTSNNLPIGMQLSTAWWKEEMLFKVGACFQKQTDYHLKKALENRHHQL